MISPKNFYEFLIKRGISFFTGVPDSLLKEFCSYVDAESKRTSHLISANEGTAIGIAVGNFLATGNLPLVYLQNSGLGNTINPLLSLADKEVYSIPLILLIGWRGEPGVKDEPQHIKQGRVTPEILDSIGIPYKIIDKDANQSLINTEWAIHKALKSNSPVVLLVKKGSFSKSEKQKNNVEYNGEILLSREKAISIITNEITKDSFLVATTGMISRELYEQRSIFKQKRDSDFLTVGSMGHASQIALGISNAKPQKQIICLDGDGAALMHLGGMATIGTSSEGKLVHIVLNNGSHDSVGGQPTVANEISLTAIAKACNYKKVYGPLIEENEIINSIHQVNNEKGNIFIEIKVKKGSRADLGRPKETPIENKKFFIANLKN